MAVKCLILVVEQKFKVLWKAKKEIHQNMHSKFSSIERNSYEKIPMPVSMEAELEGPR